MVKVSLSAKIYEFSWWLWLHLYTPRPLSSIEYNYAYNIIFKFHEDPFNTFDLVLDH